MVRARKGPSPAATSRAGPSRRPRARPGVASFSPGPIAKPAPALSCACGGGCPRCRQAEAHDRPAEVVRAGPAAELALPVVTFKPGESTEGSGGQPVEDGPGAGASPGSSTTQRCQVQSFKMTFDGWTKEWPNSSSEYVLQLSVNFELELAKGTSRADCLIGQERKGEVKYGRFKRSGRIELPLVERVASSEPVWTRDAPQQGFWWDGSAWQAGRGSWRFTLGGMRSEHATFEDQPGFASPSALPPLLSRGYVASGLGLHSFPIYWGGVGRSGHYEFRTFVKDAATGNTVRQLTWGMLIDYANPSSGAHYFYI